MTSQAADTFRRRITLQAGAGNLALQCAARALAIITPAAYRLARLNTPITATIEITLAAAGQPESATRPDSPPPIPPGGWRISSPPETVDVGDRQ